MSMQGYTWGMIDPLTDTLTSEAKRIEQECGVHPGAFSVACMIAAVGLSLQAGGDARHVANWFRASRGERPPSMKHEKLEENASAD